MESLGRVNVYRNIIENNDLKLNGEIIKLFKLNERILKNIETLFLIRDNIQNRDSLFEMYIQDIINQGQNLAEAVDVPNYRKLLNDIIEIEESKKKTANKFNALIKKLSEFNDRRLENLEKQGVFIFSDYKPKGLEDYKDNAYNSYLEENYNNEENSMVFLSYAYEDKLYTIALFFYFQIKKIFLYIDWMNNGKEDKGNVLKQKLRKALDNSKQLVFLRTPNSELKIEGNYYVRPWCSWELGNFYERQGSGQKFFIDLYDHGKIDNLQLDGIKLLTGVANGELSGIMQ